MRLTATNDISRDYGFGRGKEILAAHDQRTLSMVLSQAKAFKNRLDFSNMPGWPNLVSLKGQETAQVC